MTYKKFNLLKEVVEQGKSALVQLVLTWLVKSGLVNDLLKLWWNSRGCLVHTTLNQRQIIVFILDSRINSSVYLSYLSPLEISLPNVSAPHKNQAWPQIIHVLLDRPRYLPLKSYDDLYQTIQSTQVHEGLICAHACACNLDCWRRRVSQIPHVYV